MPTLTTILVLLVTAGSLAACGAGVPDDDTHSEIPCLRADELASLSAAPILADKPAGARLVESYAECTMEGTPYAGRFYETSMSAAEVAAFYRAAVRKQGWITYRLDPSPNFAEPFDGEDFLCARPPGPGSVTYLELWWPDNDSNLLNGLPEGTVYALDLGEVPRNDTSCREPANEAAVPGR